MSELERTMRKILVKDPANPVILRMSDIVSRIIFKRHVDYEEYNALMFFIDDLKKVYERLEHIDMRLIPEEEVMS